MLAKNQYSLKVCAYIKSIKYRMSQKWMELVKLSSTIIKYNVIC